MIVSSQTLPDKAMNAYVNATLLRLVGEKDLDIAYFNADPFIYEDISTTDIESECKLSRLVPDMPRNYRSNAPVYVIVIGTLTLAVAAYILKHKKETEYK